MRASTGGWVENIFDIRPGPFDPNALSGSAMKSWETAGFTFIGIRAVPALIFSSADARARVNPLFRLRRGQPRTHVNG